jgi:hypothetical protein
VLLGVNARLNDKTLLPSAANLWQDISPRASTSATSSRGRSTR